MIKVETIIIEDFRGIRYLKLEPKAENFAVAGPNGTGKSGVVDAVEFALTGSISRLTGQGRGDLSVLKHGPHVDMSSIPEKAQVTLEVIIPSLNKKAKIIRNVKNASNPIISPNDPEIIKAFSTIENHPEFVLSRREIIKYVLAEPGNRAKEVQNILQLNDLEKLRSVLQKISNAEVKEFILLEQERNITANSLMQSMGINQLTSGKVLEAANKKRAVLGLVALPKLEAKTLLNDGMESLGNLPINKVSKKQAMMDIEEAINAVNDLYTDETKKQKEKIKGEAEELQKDEKSLQGIKQQTMLNYALELFDEHNCPVCEEEWDIIHFKKVIENKLEKLKQISEARKSTELLISEITEKIVRARRSIKNVVQYGPLLSTPIATKDLEEYVVFLQEKENSLEKFLPLSNTLSALELNNEEAKKSLKNIGLIKSAANSIPEATDRDEARDYLTITNERLQKYRTASTKYRIGKQKADNAKIVFDTFAEITNKALEDIYKEVEEEFRGFYRLLNSEDENTFDAKLTPSIGKLGFGVDFYGRGFFPPGAYHSEGHQDGMGLCLYLALMKHILGDGFTIAVLDDVLMSVDIGHRRKVCELLKEHFKNTQFILTTHDPVWLRHMRSSGLLSKKSGIEFQNWDVNKGPSQWIDIDIWGEINSYLDKSDIRGASSLMRNHLEYLATEYCNELGAKVEFQSDHNYEFGSLISASISEMKNLFGKAKASAQSWGNDSLLKVITEKEAQFELAAKSSIGEQWQINPIIHWSEWANFQKEDFKPVVEAFKNLTKQFSCEKCNSNLYVTRSGYTKDSLRCSCNDTNFNLTLKPKN